MHIKQCQFTAFFKTFCFCHGHLQKWRGVRALTFRLKNHVGVCVCVCMRGLLVLNSKKVRVGILMLNLKSWGGLHILILYHARKSRLLKYTRWTFSPFTKAFFLSSWLLFSVSLGWWMLFVLAFPPQFYINVSKFSPFYAAKHSPLHLYRRIL